MAKLKKKSERKEIEISPERAAFIKRLCIHGAIAGLFFGGLGAGFYYVKQYVDREVVMPTEPPTIVIKDKPRWMSDFLVQRIAASARPSGLHSAFDHAILVKDRIALAKNPWVSKVYEVRRAFRDKPGDTLEIDCEYRVPAAIVKWGVCYWLVDRDGYKLPEVYEAHDLPKIVIAKDGLIDIRVIDGVHSPPPETGKWPGADLAAGLEMVRLLSDKPYAQDIDTINVAHFSSVREPHIVLMTKFKTEVRWGRTPSELDKEPYMEISTARKLDRLKRLFTQFGRVDAGEKAGLNIYADDGVHEIAEPAGAVTNGNR